MPSTREAPLASTELWNFACPICMNRIITCNPTAGATGDTHPAGNCSYCVGCGQVYGCSAGIWRFLPEQRLARYEQFLREYRIVRADQGWGRPDAAYFLALPQIASVEPGHPDDPHAEIWQRRRMSYGVLRTKIIGPLASREGRPLRILDVGAGNCWLAHRMAQCGHHVAAIDLSVDPTDGLGAHVWYHEEHGRAGRSSFTVIQAEFNYLPLADNDADVIVFNASLHYAEDCAATLREALRVLSEKGVLVIMDSPVYRDSRGGEQMVSERTGEFERRYGFRSESLKSEHFLTSGRLEVLACDLGLRWRVYRRLAGVSRVMEQWRRLRRMIPAGRLRGFRELAEMPVIAGHRV